MSKSDFFCGVSWWASVNNQWTPDDWKQLKETLQEEVERKQTKQDT